LVSDRADGGCSDVDADLLTAYRGALRAPACRAPFTAKLKRHICLACDGLAKEGHRPIKLELTSEARILVRTVEELAIVLLGGPDHVVSVVIVQFCADRKSL
jgi:hypothetical protein